MLERSTLMLSDRARRFTVADIAFIALVLDIKITETLARMIAAEGVAS